MSGKGFNPFKSKKEAMERAIRTHLCTACTNQTRETWKTCPKCGAPEANRQYMASKVETNRACELILQQRLGQISDLQLQPRFALIVEGVKIATYIADFTYTLDGKKVVEDTKPLKFIDKYAKLKIDLFNSLYAKDGLKVLISKRG